MGPRKNSRRVSLGGVPLSDSPQAERRVSLSRETFAHDEKKRVSMPADEEEAESAKKAALAAEGVHPTTLSGEELERKFEKQQSNVAMSPEVETVLKAPPNPHTSHAHHACTYGWSVSHSSRHRGLQSFNNMGPEPQ